MEMDHSEPDIHHQPRGVGTDIAIVTSMVFVAQIIVSSTLGIIIQAAGTTKVIPISSSVFSLLALGTAGIGVRYNSNPKASNG